MYFLSNCSLKLFYISTTDGNVAVVPPYDCVHVSDRAKEIVKVPFVYIKFLVKGTAPLLNNYISIENTPIGLEPTVPSLEDKSLIHFIPFNYYN